VGKLHYRVLSNGSQFTTPGSLQGELMAASLRTPNATPTRLAS